MKLYETENGDKWVCTQCAKEEAEMIAEKKWEFIFDRNDDMSRRCSLCNRGDFEDYEDFV